MDGWFEHLRHLAKGSDGAVCFCPSILFLPLSGNLTRGLNSGTVQKATTLCTPPSARWSQAVVVTTMSVTPGGMIGHDITAVVSHWILLLVSIPTREAWVFNGLLGLWMDLENIKKVRGSLHSIVSRTKPHMSARPSTTS